MPQVSVSVGGRTYRIACAEGEEEHLTRLAGTVDDRIGTMRAEFGEIGDQRMTVMAAITLADEVADMRGRLDVLEAKLASLAAERHEEALRFEAMGAAVARAIDETAVVVEEVTARLSGQRE